MIKRLEGEAAVRAIVGGLGLHAVKAQIGHGKFLPWLIKQSQAVGNRQCRYYMRLALAFVEHSQVPQPEMLAVSESGFQLTVRDGLAGKFADRIDAFVGGKSLNELLDEYGIKDVKQLGGARTPAGKGGKGAALDAEQLYLFARDEIGGVIQRAEELFIKQNQLQHLVDHPEEVRGVVASLRTLADKVESAAKPLLKRTHTTS